MADIDQINIKIKLTNKEIPHFHRSRMDDLTLPSNKVAMATVEVLSPHLLPSLLHLLPNIPPHARIAPVPPQNGKVPRCIPGAEKSGKVEQEGDHCWF